MKDYEGMNIFHVSLEVGRYNIQGKGNTNKKPVMEIRLFQESGSLSISPEDLILHFFLVNMFCPYW